MGALRGHLCDSTAFLLFVFLHLYLHFSVKPPLSLASTEDAACIRDSASIRSFTGRPT